MGIKDLFDPLSRFIGDIYSRYVTFGQNLRKLEDILPNLTSHVESWKAETDTFIKSTIRTERRAIREKFIPKDYPHVYLNEPDQRFFDSLRKGGEDAIASLSGGISEKLQAKKEHLRLLTNGHLSEGLNSLLENAKILKGAYCRIIREELNANEDLIQTKTMYDESLGRYRDNLSDISIDLRAVAAQRRWRFGGTAAAAIILGLIVYYGPSFVEYHSKPIPNLVFLERTDRVPFSENLCIPFPGTRPQYATRQVFRIRLQAAGTIDPFRVTIQPDSKTDDIIYSSPDLKGNWESGLHQSSGAENRPLDRAMHEWQIRNQMAIRNEMYFYVCIGSNSKVSIQLPRFVFSKLDQVGPPLIVRQPHIWDLPRAVFYRMGF